tara:strand:+ start:64 stop:432 length:369 start_codon:yes stop_codon:yes gene_type:complete
MKKDLNEIAKYEKAIQKKYGKEAIQNPKNNWTQEKEKEFLSQLKDFYKQRAPKEERYIKEGFEVVDKKKSKTQPRNCPCCGSYSLSSKDDLYMLKYECCFNCYIQYVDGREERWKTGWRPNK